MAIDYKALAKTGLYSSAKIAAAKKAVESGATKQIGSSSGSSSSATVYGGGGGSSSGSSVQRPVAPQTPASVYNVNTATPDQVKARILAYRASQQTNQDLTPAEVYKDAGYSDDPYSQALGIGLMSAQNDMNMEVDENRIRRDILRQYQGEIDATNQIYQQQMSLAQQQGMGRLGSDRAMSARSGLLGSDFAAANQTGVERENQQTYNTIDAAKLATIGQIMSTARIEAQNEINAKKAAKAAGSESYIKYLAEKQSNDQNRQSNFIKSLMSRGVTLSELNPAELKKIATSLGTNQEGLEALYADQQAMMEEAQAKANAENAKFELEQRKVDIDEAYKNGQLTLAERKAAQDNAVAWFNANTSRMKFENDAKADESGGAGSKEDVQQSYQLAKADNTLRLVEEALTKVNGLTAGFGGLLSKIPSTDSKELSTILTAIKANIGFNELQAMRAASPTGGALGQVAVQELESLQAVLGSLSQTQSPDALRENLKDVQRHYQAWKRTLGGSQVSQPTQPNTADDIDSFLDNI